MGTRKGDKKNRKGIGTIIDRVECDSCGRWYANRLLKCPCGSVNLEAFDFYRVNKRIKNAKRDTISD